MEASKLEVSTSKFSNKVGQLPANSKRPLLVIISTMVSMAYSCFAPLICLSSSKLVLLSW